MKSESGTPVGAVEAAAASSVFSCSAHHDSHHGLTNAIVMPYVLTYNRSAIEEKMIDLARWLDLKPISFAGAMDWILELRSRLAIPHRLDALGIGEADIALLARDAEADPLTALNPRPVAEADYRLLYSRALNGQLG